MLLLQLGVARAQARDTKRIAVVNQVRSAVELYFDDNGNYFASTTMSGLSPKYLQNVPIDPLATGCTDAGSFIYDGVAGGAAQCYGYAYSPATSPIRYQVWAELEQFNKSALGADSDIVSTAWSGAVVNGAADTSAGCTSATTNDCVFDLGQN